MHEQCRRLAPARRDCAVARSSETALGPCTHARSGGRQAFAGRSQRGLHAVVRHGFAPRRRCRRRASQAPERRRPEVRDTGPWVPGRARRSLPEADACRKEQPSRRSRPGRRPGVGVGASCLSVPAGGACTGKPCPCGPMCRPCTAWRVSCGCRGRPARGQGRVMALASSWSRRARVQPRHWCKRRPWGGVQCGMAGRPLHERHP